MEAKQVGIDDIMVSGDFNQDLMSNSMQEFLRVNGLYEVHHEVNMIDSSDRDKTSKSGSNQIDGVFSTKGILQHIEGYKLTNFEEIILTDYRGFIFDINIKLYFNINCSQYD